MATEYKMAIKNWLSRGMKTILGADMHLVARTLSVYFFVIFHLNVGFPPVKPLSATSLTYLVLFVFFLLLPAARKITIGKYFEFEAKYEKLKEDMQEFKTEMKQSLAVYSNLMSTVSNVSNQSVNFHFPGLDEAERIKEELDSSLHDTVTSSDLEEKVANFLAESNDDTQFALMRLRMEIERELRRILGKRVTMKPSTGGVVKYNTVRTMFRELVKSHPEYKDLDEPLYYTLDVCNAAIHGQTVPNGHAYEALYMGIRILTELREIQPSATR